MLKAFSDIGPSLGSSVKNLSFVQGLLFLLLFLGGFPSLAQQTIVKGKVTDLLTGQPVPFANVVFSGSEVGGTTNFDGYYSISTSKLYDSVTVSYVGYVTEKIKIKPYQIQTIHVELEQTALHLQEIVVYSGELENPAFAIMRKVIDHKEQNDKRGLKAYEYESYSKVEVDVSKMAENLRKQIIVRDIEAALDSMPPITDEEGQPLTPIFLSESISEFYFRKDPNHKKEKILKTKVKGVGIEDGGVISQLLGSSLQDYNFYQNWLSFLDKKLVSPIADNWNLYYDYDLVDSLYISDVFCYRMEVFPKHEQDLAFYGTIWITKEEYALKQLDLSIRKSANLNFIDKLHIQQQLVQTSAGNWLPEKTRAVISLRPFKLTDTGFLMKFYTSIESPRVNEPHEPHFYRHSLEVATDAEVYPEEFWQHNRHDSLTTEEIQVLQMIDTVNASPSIRRSVAFIKALGSGFIDLGKVEFGPFPLLFLHNQVEGSRIGLGLRTNREFSSKVRFSGFGAYGVGDQQIKYNLSADYILSHQRWTVLRFTTEREVEQVGLDPEVMRSNYFFYASSKWGRLDSPYLYRNTSLRFQTDLWKGGTSTIFFRSVFFNPLYSFEYKKGPDLQFSSVFHSFATTELGAELRLAYNENLVLTNFNRISMNNSKWPIFTIRYIYGMEGVLNADFEYHKFMLKAYQRINLAFLGITSYNLEGGKILNPLPYPLLQVHAGNESFFYTNAAFNLMNYMEFVSDTYASFRMLHNFDGHVLNKVPFIRKFKWRLLAEANLLYGSLNERNQELLDISGNENTLAHNLSSLSKIPYVEVGYGIENILRFIRIDAFHRLTYLDKPNIRKFGVKISAQISL